MVFLLLSCNQNAQVVPKEINNNGKTNFDIPNTKLSIKKPAEFSFYPELSRLEAEKNKFVQFVEMDGANFSEKKLKFLSGIDSKIQAGGKLDLKEEIKIGEYDGVFLIAPQREKQITQTILLFGDKTFTTMIAGFSPINDKSAQKEIQDIILSVSYDKTKSVNLESQIPFIVDLKNSNYKLTKIISGIAFYTIAGNGNLFSDKLENNFFVQIFPGKLSKNDMEKYSENFVRDLKVNSFPEKNVTVKSLTSQNYLEGGNEVLETNLTNEYQGKENKMILILKSTNKGTILFSATDLSGNNISQFKKIMKSVTIK